MQAVWQLAINSLAGRRGRTALLVIAVTLAAALSVLVACAIATLMHAYGGQMGRIAGSADVLIRQRARGRIDADVLEKARQWPAVVSAAGRLQQKGAVMTPIDGEASLAVDAQGLQPGLDEQFFPTDMLRGRDVERDGEVAVDQRIADELGVEIGDRVTFEWTTVELEIVGIVKQTPLSIMQLPLARMTLADVQTLSGYPDTLDYVYIELRDDVADDVEAFIAAHNDELPKGVMFEPPASVRAGINRAIRWSSLMSHIVTALVCLSTVFIVITGLTTAVTERTHELAVLRCIGTSRWQIGAAQVAAGVSIAAVGAIVGTPLGLAGAYGLFRWHEDTLGGEFIVPTDGVSIAIASVIFAGLFGALYPAIMAAKVRPLEALAARAAQPKRAALLMCLGGGVIGVLFQPLILLLAPDAETAFWIYLPGGLALLFIGFCLLAVPALVAIAPLLCRVIGALLRLPVELLRESVLATPFRHGLTAGALMMGLAILLAIWTEGGNLLYGWFDRIAMPDAFIYTAGRSLNDEAMGVIESHPQVTSHCEIIARPIRTRNVQFGVKQISPPFTLFASSDIEAFLDMTQVEWVQGDRATALPKIREGNAVLVGREYLVAHGIGVGATVTLASETHGDVEFEIVGVVGATGLDVAVQHFGIGSNYAEASVSTVFGSREDGVKYFGMERPDLLLLELTDEADDDAVLADLRERLGPIIGSVQADSSRRIRDFVHSISVQLMAVASSIGVACLLIASFGVANLIVAEVNARRYEFGVLRAIGGQRSMLGRLIIAQTLIIALLACLIGGALGMAVAAIGKWFHAKLVGVTYGWEMPWLVLIAGSATVIVMALGAAAPAMWRLMQRKTVALLAADA